MITNGLTFQVLMLYKNQIPFFILAANSGMKYGIILFISLAMWVNVRSQCSAVFTFNINGFSASFFSQAISSQGTIVAYSWNFGDPASGSANTSSLQHPIHVFGTPGTYLVTHSIATAMGCLNDTVMMVVIPPAFYEVHLCPPAASTAIPSNSNGSNYQWQISPDNSSYSNLADNSIFSGTLTNQLQLANLPSSFTGTFIRCITDGNAGIPRKIIFANNFTGGQNNLWSNPSNWSCGVLPDEFTVAEISTGNIIVDVNSTVYSLTLNPPATITVQSGVNLNVIH